MTFTATVAVVSPGVNTPTGTVTFKDGATVLGTGTLNGGVATFTRSTPLSVGAHNITAVYSGDTNNLGSTGTLTGGQVAITRVAGNKDGEAGFGGDGGPATQAQLNHPEGVAVDLHDGTFYIADTDNNRIREVRTNGIITTVAGNGMPGYNDDGIKATDAKLNAPDGRRAGRPGNLFIADTGNNRIREVRTDGVIVTIAGNGDAGFGGDGGPATQAQLNHPEGVALDARGNLFIADTDNDRIREVRTDGVIVTIAGDAGFGGDGGPATQAQLNHPEGVALDARGNLFIADTGNNRIREVSPNGIITTVAGNGTAAILNAPTGIAVGASGNLFIADTGNNRIRVVDPFGGITTLAVGASALNRPAGIAVDSAGSLLVASFGSNQILQITGAVSEVVVEAGVPNLPPSKNTQPSILLVPAQSSSLALIATLVVTSLNGGESQNMSAEFATTGALPTQALAQSGEGGEKAHAADESGNPQGAVPSPLRSPLKSWILFLLGPDEALDRIRRAIPDLFTSGDGRQGPVGLLGRDYQAVVRAIDEAIHALAPEGHPSSLPALPVRTFVAGSTIIAVLSVRRVLLRYRRRKDRSSADDLGVEASVMG